MTKQNQSSEKLRGWINIALAVLALLAGSGWGKYYLELRDQRKIMAENILEGFLIPLQAKLEQNEKFYLMLTHDLDLQRLEYSPIQVQYFFDSLPDDDSRKITWHGIIDILMETNSDITKSIEDNFGRIVTQDFQEASMQFIHHAKLWEATWRSLTDRSPISYEQQNFNEPLTPPFPVNLDSALSLEIIEWRRRAGD